MRSLTPRGVSPRTSAAAALALISVSVAVWLSLQDSRAYDFFRVQAWGADWLAGHDLYTAGPPIDYPPWAIVTLSPLAWLPAGAALPIWVGLNVGMLLCAAWALSRERTAHDRVMVACLLAAAATGRTLNQFSLLAFMAGVLSLRGGAIPTGLWLGVACVKPQVGAVFMQLAAMDRQLRRAITACAVPVALTIVYAAHARIALSELPAAFLRRAFVEYGNMPLGRTELTPWLSRVWPTVGTVGATLLIAAVVLLPLAWVRSTGWRRALAALSSLLAIRHLSYDLLLLLPAAVTLDGAVLWLAALLAIADPSAVAARFWPDAWISWHADRVLLSGLWLWGAFLPIVASQSKRQSMTK